MPLDTFKVEVNILLAALHCSAVRNSMLEFDFSAYPPLSVPTATQRIMQISVYTYRLADMHCSNPVKTKCTKCCYNLCTNRAYQEC